jgi:hypothetical protein
MNKRGRMNIDLAKLDFTFITKPLLIGEMPMDKPKYHHDLELIVKKVTAIQYAHYVPNK